MDLARMSLGELVDSCRVETEKFRRGVPSLDHYCFELIRRAVSDRLDAAWEAVLAQYRGMVLAWIWQHPASGQVVEDEDYWVGRSFERFWTAVGPDQIGRFPGLSSLLRYLKLCVHSVLLDEVRGRAAAKHESFTEAVVDGRLEAPDTETLALGRLNGSELWQAIVEQVSDDTEQLVMRLSLVHDLKPGEIFERHRDRFESVADVYRIKRNVLERLQRSPAVRAFQR